MEALRRCIESVYNDATQQFIIMKAGDSYVLGGHYIKCNGNGNGYRLFDRSGPLQNDISTLEAAIALSYSMQVDNISTALEIKRYISAYDKHDGDVTTYKRQLAAFTESGEYGKMDHIEARLSESASVRAYFRNRIKMYCIKQLYKLKAVDKYS